MSEPLLIVDDAQLREWLVRKLISIDRRLTIIEGKIEEFATSSVNPENARLLKAELIKVQAILKGELE